ncbi:MAG: exonuclease SbcCD subunit D C-terminal domain-containing protein [Cardiobacteriaceae bacterium]|nr:exonuclease SbcCD subunit D C-terminal domain-containing protein [Cardiobacteriaceae bacterium]
MKILHTADWHLGRNLYGRQRYKEFTAFLDWLLNTIRTQCVDTLLVAGDIFDTGTPPHRAQALYYQFLCQVATTNCRHVVIIAGNHDSPSFLDAPREILRALHVHVIGNIGLPSEEVLLLRDTEDAVELIVCAVPYLRERDIRKVDGDESVEDKAQKLLNGIRAHYEDTVAYAVAQRTALHNDNIPIIATGHLFAAGGQTSDGDGTHDLYIGTLAHVPADAFPEAIDYLALGHLHQPQCIAGNITRRYSGAPLALGFGEAGKPKSVCLVTFKEKKAYIETLDIPCWQRLERISGDWPHIEQRLQILLTYHESIWLEIHYDGAEIMADLRERLESIVANSSLEILRIKNNRVTAQVLAQDHAAETLNDLNVLDVFTRCLDAHGIPQKQRAALQDDYCTILTTLNDEPQND